MTIPEKFPAFLVNEKGEATVTQFPADQMEQGEVVIKVAFSALNYKDALAAKANPGVARKLPLIPGIDAVGKVAGSSDERFLADDEVLIAHAKFGTASLGGLASYSRVPADWVYKLPDGLSMVDAATLGTAGFTAAQSVEKIVESGIEKDNGPVLVTGATGGVGIFAVKLLAKLGYEVVASTGKQDRHDWLLNHGASQVVDRSELNDSSETPLLKGRWAAAVDTVGGNTLETVLRTTKPHGCVTACGLVGGHGLKGTVYPFILRGLTLCGIDSAGIDRETRMRLWGKIAGDWKLDLDEIATEITLDEFPNAVEQILKGKIFGRTLVRF